MKRVLLLLLTFCTLQSYAGDSDTTILSREVYADAKSGFKEVISGIKDLTSKLEGPAKRLYDTYIWQQRAEGVGMLVAFIVAIFGTGLTARWLWGMGRKAESNHDDEDPWFISSTILGIICAIISIVFIFACSCIFTMMVNPEYHAIKEIIETLK